MGQRRVVIESYLKDIEVPRYDYRYWPHKGGGTSLHVSRVGFWARFLRWVTT